MLATMVLDITKSLTLLLLCLHSVSASPILGDAALQARQFPCSKGQSYGCLPIGNSGWNSFDLVVPAAGDGLVRNAHSPGEEVRAEVWNRQDGTAFLAIRLGEDYEPRLPATSVEVQAWIGSTRITLNNNSFHYFYDVALATIPATILSNARLNPSPVTITIKWRAV